MGLLFPEYKKIERIIEEYSDMVLRVAFTYMKNIADAEDIAQEVFIKLVENPPSFHSDDTKKHGLLELQ